MLEKIATIFFTHKAKSDILKTKSLVNHRIKQVDSGVLGRSLSCNPLMPRNFRSITNAKPLIATHTKHLNANSKYNIAIIDTSLKKDISLVANARHYSPFLIIHKDIFISKYQILESLVFGADCVALSPDILMDNSLFMLQDYAYHLGLEVAILASKISHFQYNARIFITAKNMADSTEIPQNRLIITI